jgi:hypothetical protein
VPVASGAATGEAGWLSAAGGTLLASGVGHTGGGVLTAQATIKTPPPIMDNFLANRKKFDMILLLLEALAALLILVFIVWWTMFSGRQGGEIKSDEDAEKARQKDKKDD